LTVPGNGAVQHEASSAGGEYEHPASMAVNTNSNRISQVIVLKLKPGPIGVRKPFHGYYADSGLAGCPGA